MSASQRSVAAICFWTLLLVRPGLVQAQAVDPDFAAAIERVLSFHQPTTVAADWAKAFGDNMAEALKSRYPTLTDRHFAVMRDVIDHRFQEAFSKNGPVRAAYVAAYAKHFTRADVDNLIAFFSSETGRKLSAFDQSFTSEETDAWRHWMVDTAPQLSAEVQARFKEEGLPPMPN